MESEAGTVAIVGTYEERDSGMSAEDGGGNGGVVTWKETRENMERSTDTRL